jgi:predicted RNase H-like HicB family nuclease
LDTLIPQEFCSFAVIGYYPQPTNSFGENTMKHTFTAHVTQEDGWFVAQCIEVDVASQGRNKEEALANLSEALELHFEEPQATILPQLEQIEVEMEM